MEGLITRRAGSSLSAEPARPAMGWVQGVFDCLGDAIFIHDASTGAILHANSRACELYGYSPGELCRCSVADISSNVPPYSQEDALRWMQRTFHDGMQLFEW
jgi:PAS domain-containing protein